MRKQDKLIKQARANGEYPPKHSDSGTTEVTTRLRIYRMAEGQIKNIALSLEAMGMGRHYSNYDVAPDAIGVRARIADCVFLGEQGQPVLAVHEWGRDCDLCEATRVHLIPAPSVLAAYNNYVHSENAMYNNAEGPCAMYPMTKAKYKTFQPTFRDHAAEQMNY